MKKLLTTFVTAILISSSICSPSIAQTLDIESPQVLASGVNPRGFTQHNGQIYFSAQRDSDVASWNKILLWSSQGAASSTLPVKVSTNQLLYPKIFLGQYDEYYKQYSKYAVNGSEMLSLGGYVYLSTFDGIAKLDLQSGQTITAKFRRAFSLVNYNMSENRSGMFLVKGKIYQLAFGELWEVTPETMSIKQLTNYTEKRYSRTNSYGATSSYYYMISDIGVAGESLVVALSTVGSLQFSSSSLMSSSIVAFKPPVGDAPMVATPLAESASQSTLRTSGTTPLVDVFVYERIFQKVIGRYLGNGNSLITKEVIPFALSSEFRTYDNLASDTGELYSMTRGRYSSTLWRGATVGDLTTWKALWSGTETLSRGYISQIKATGGNIYLRYSSGETIIVRADGTWRNVLATDSDAKYVDIIFNSTERLRVGDYLYFSSANGSDLLSAKIKTRVKPASYRAATVGMAQPLTSPSPVMKRGI
jgi:hypothetical protein